MLAPVIFSVAKLTEDYRGFAFLAPVNHIRSQFPATLRRDQPQNSLNDQQSTTHARDKQDREYLRISSAFQL
ncbi:replication protein RepA [Escherichia coli]|nr:replication protein RepA [Escherichia coli]